MYVVQCPKCQQRLKVKEELHQVKVRCSKCKEIFLADTSEMEESPAQAVAPAAPPPKKAAPPAQRPASPALPKVASPSKRPSAPAPKPAPAAPAPNLVPAEEEPALGVAPIDLGAPVSASTPPPGPPVIVPARRVIRKKSKAPMIIVIVAAVLIPIIAYGVYWNSTHVNVANRGWILKSDYDAEMKKIKDEQDAASSGALPPAANSAAPGRNPANSARRPAGNAAWPPDNSAAPEPPVEKDKTDYTNVNYDPAEVKGPEKAQVRITSNMGRPIDGYPGTGTLVGEVQNIMPDKTIKSLTLSFEVMDLSPRPRCATGQTVLEYIPPNGIVKFSVTYGQVGKYLRAVAKVEVAPDNTACWMVDPAEGKFRFEPVGDKVKLSGYVVNSTDSIVKDPVVLVSFFTNDGEFVANLQAKLDEQGSLGRGVDRHFAVEYDTKSNTKTLVPVGLINNKPEVRLVGKK